MGQAGDIFRKLLKPGNLWLLFIGGILFLLIFILVMSFQDLPSFEELENPKSDLATQLYTHDGAVLGRLFLENRVNVDYNDLNPHLIDALVATEDVRYHRHSGIDFRALARVIVKTIFLQRSSAGGGSTITQQLAKLLYSDRNFTGMNTIEKTFALLSRKIKEWITAVKLERAYTKEEIIAM
ncbi:MAG TPA: biosynthetic peptidoglycan transglycosylase, partial [Saprospiraceae bacterium]|nr:biosynthetic peptidoglycan transglycosylase [Saprospiraceae bacterium]